MRTRAKNGQTRSTTFHYLRFDHALILRDASTQKTYETHGVMYDAYRQATRGGATTEFDPDGAPNSKLGLPVSDEHAWMVGNQEIGRIGTFEWGQLYWRARDNAVRRQLIDTDELVYWGIDGVETYKTLRQNAKIDRIAKAVPCFKGIYLPKAGEAPEPKAKDIHDVFGYSLGLTRILLIDALHAPKGGSKKKGQYDLAGEQPGIDAGFKACVRASDMIDAYGALAPNWTAPAAFQLFHDVEPNFKVDLAFLRGYLKGVAQFNTALGRYEFNGGFYMSFDTKSNPSRQDNLDNIDALTGESRPFALWAQHPNLPSITEEKIFEHGFAPLAPQGKQAEIWQFNNYDSRFRRPNSTQFWLDHDAATAPGFELLWSGDPRLYTV